MLCRTLRTITGAGVVVIALALTACGSDDREPSMSDSTPTGQAMVPITPPTAAAPTAGPQPSLRSTLSAVAPNASRSGPATEGSPPGRATPPPGAQAQVCSADHLTVRVIRQQAVRAGAPPSALLTFTNTSRRACSLDGWPLVALLNETGERIAVPTTRVREPTAVTVHANRTAFAGLSWRTCAKSEATCAVGTRFRVTPPAASTPAVTMLVGFPSAASSGIAMRSMRISPIQKTTTGATDW